MMITWRNRTVTAIIFLVFLVAVIEGTGYLYTLGRIQSGARWGVRFAVTDGCYTQYCKDATSTLNLLEADLSDGAVDCKVTLDYCSEEGLSRCGEQSSSAREGAEYLTNRLTDWARLPSIRDEALISSSGININLQASGDYLEYLKTHDKKWLGDPSVPGYFHVTVCSRPNIAPEHSRFSLSWDGNLPLCFDNSEKIFVDDGGEAWDRVTVIVAYTYTPVIPFLRLIWPTIPMMVSREGVVEGYVPGIVYGFEEAIPYSGTPVKPPRPRPATLTPFPTVTPLPKNWLGVSQNHSDQVPTLSFLLTILLIVVMLGGFYAGRMIKAFLHSR